MNENKHDANSLSTLYLYCSCHELSHLIRASYWHDDAETYYIETVAPPTSIFRRVWQAFRWVLGLDKELAFGETVLSRKDAYHLRDHLDVFLKNEQLLSEKTRLIYDWLLKYDERFKNNPEALTAYLMATGAEHLYAESLKNAQPIDPEIVRELSEAGQKAFGNYVVNLEDDDEGIF